MWTALSLGLSSEEFRGNHLLGILVYFRAEGSNSHWSGARPRDGWLATPPELEFRGSCSRYVDISMWLLRKGKLGHFSDP